MELKDLRKKLEQAITVTDGFGRDARSIMNSLNIKDPDDDEIQIHQIKLAAYGVREAVNN